MKNLITKYLNDTISEEELQRLSLWVRDDHNQKTFKDYVKIHYRLQQECCDLESDAAFEAVMKKIRPAKSSLTFRSWLRVAALIVGVLLIGYGVYLNITPSYDPATTDQITLTLDDGTIKVIDGLEDLSILNAEGEEISRKINNKLIYTSKTADGKIVFNTLSVPFGKTFEIVLADGSLVVLNAGTRFRYPTHFNGSESRTVFLDGEAYFDVTRDSIQPFVVHTKDMDIKVLGTEFVVDSYHNDDLASAVLITGKIEAENHLDRQDRLEVQPNERVYFEAQQLTIEKVNVQKYVSWVQGQLVFIEDSFDLIINKLERKFNVKIDNQYSELNAIEITATFTDESIETVLKTFQAYKNFDYSYENGILVIKEPKRKK